MGRLTFKADSSCEKACIGSRVHKPNAGDNSGFIFFKLTLLNTGGLIMDKIKAFFENKVTKIVSWVVLALAVVSLIIGGVTAETINSGVALVAGIVAAIAAFIAFICGQVKK